MQLPPKFKTQLLKSLDINIPISITAPLIDDEGYWQKCCKAREAWQPCRVADYGRSWKRLFLERNLEDMLETCKPEDEEEMMDMTNENGILSVATISAPYVFSFVCSGFFLPCRNWRVALRYELVAPRVHACILYVLGDSQMAYSRGKERTRQLEV